MPAGAVEAPPTPEVVSLQQRLEQIEAAIDNAHEIVSRIAPRGDAEGTARDSTCLLAADRCIDSLAQLNDRLRPIADQVGQL